MIGSQSSIRTAVSLTSSRADSGRASSHNENSLAGNLSGVSVTTLQFPGSSEVDSDGVLHFSQSSANGQPLGEVNKAKHMEVFFTSLQKHGANIGNLEKLTQVMNHGYGRDLKNSTIEQGTKVALALFNAVPADMQDKALIGKATAFYQAMDNFSQSPGSTAKKDSAYQALKTLTSALSEKLGLSGKNYKSDNLTKFCADYLKKDVCSDIISKLEGKLSPGILEGLRKNPEGAVEYLYDGQNTTNNNTIDMLKAQFAQYTNKGDKVMVMYSLLAALEQKTQIIAGLMPDIATPDAPSSPVDGIAVDQDIAQPAPAPANGNNTAKPGSVAPNITNITTTNNYYYGSSPSTRTYISTETINISGTETTTKPENNQPQSATASQTQADMADSSTQAFDGVDSAPASPATDNLKPAASASTSATNKSLNSSGTLLGMKGPAPSWLGKDAKVSLTNDGQVRDLSRKQSYGQDGVEQKQPTSLNSFGNQFVGFGQQDPAPALLRGADKAEQDTPQVNDAQSSSTLKDIPVSDNALNSDTTPKDADGIYHAVPAKVVAERQVNAQGTSFGMKAGAASASTQSEIANNDSAVTLTRGGQVRDLSRKQADGLGGAQQKQPTSLNTFGNQFVGVGQQNPAPAPLGGADKAEQDTPQVNDAQSSSTLKDIPVSDNALNSDTTPKDADGIYHAVPAKVVAERQVNAQGTSFGMKSGATSASTQSEMANNDSAVTLTRGGQTRGLSKQLAYRLGGSQQKSVSSVNAQGNQFVGVGKNPPTPELTQSWINNKGDNVVLTQEGAQTRALTEKDRYRADKITNNRSPNMQPANSPEAE